MYSLALNHTGMVRPLELRFISNSGRILIYIFRIWKVNLKLTIPLNKWFSCLNFLLLLLPNLKMSSKSYKGPLCWVWSIKHSISLQRRLVEQLHISQCCLNQFETFESSQDTEGRKIAVAQAENMDKVKVRLYVLYIIVYKHIYTHTLYFILHYILYIVCVYIYI